MLTDDDLTRQLGDAFREDAAPMTYRGTVPTVRRAPAWASPGWVAVPAAAAVATVALVSGGGPAGAPSADGGATATTTPAGPSSSAPTTATAPGTPRTVTETFELAGMTLGYDREWSTAPKELRLRTLDAVPDWAEPTDLPPGAEGEAWVGTDPSTGDAALLLRTATRNDGKLFELMMPGFDEAAMVDLLWHGTPQ